MLIGCPKEIKNHEYRVGLTPESVAELTARGHAVLIETGAGHGIGATDDAYRAAGADIIVPHMGVTTGGTIGATTSKTLEDSVRLIDECAEAARKIRKEIIIIAHGGPIATPDDVSFVLEHSEHCNGFYGASSVERLPVETAIKSNIEAFKALKMK